MIKLRESFFGGGVEVGCGDCFATSLVQCMVWSES